MLPTFFTKLLFCAAFVQAQRELSTPKETAVPGMATPQGCFGAAPAGIADTQQRIAFLSPGTCVDACKKQQKAVALMKADKCFCTDVYPAKDSRVDDSDCNFPCPGYPRDACGSTQGAYSVWNTGIELAVAFDGSDGSDGSDDEDGKGGKAADSEVDGEARSKIGLKAILSGAWASGEGATANIMTNLCRYFDCGADDNDSD